MGTCNAGYEDCDLTPDTGCEVDTSTDVNNCGGCGIACTNANGTTSCSAGACVPVCAVGYDDCDGDPTNGCEANTDADINHCGTCNNVCTVSNGTAACTVGTCTVGGCDIGWGDCNTDVVDGCETNLDTDVNNCGACSNACNMANGTAGCSLGACTVASCDTTWGDCNGSPDDGCELSLVTDEANCGGCGVTCQNANGSNTCVAQSCVPTCSPGFDDCDGDGRNGCETDILQDANNCGACGNTCGGSCRKGVCDPTCADTVQNGAETDIDCGGGTCAPCAAGQACLVNPDCTSHVCGGDCLAPSCSDTVQNGTETDVDCGGGACSVCLEGAHCIQDADCELGSCRAGYCQPEQCTDGIKTGAETDVDCGGPCIPCVDGNSCGAPADCQSGVCAGNVCQVAACNDAVLNGTETDIDCGGICVPCGPSQRCLVNADCSSGTCTSSLTCQ
jgi:hypothetical protein